jgi:hypothetical protein
LGSPRCSTASAVGVIGDFSDLALKMKGSGGAHEIAYVF